MLDIRRIDTELRRLITEVCALKVEETYSFWMIDDNEHVELNVFLESTGFCLQTNINTRRNIESFLEITTLLASTASE